jgi:hypothetical protein
MKNTFKEEDKTKIVKFLNHVANNAKFEHSVMQSIEFVKLLTYMQQELIPKVDSNILEVKKVIENKGNDF